MIWTGRGKPLEAFRIYLNLGRSGGLNEAGRQYGVHMTGEKGEGIAARPPQLAYPYYTV